jgi:hypothetical protein
LVVSRRRVLEAVFILLELRSPSRRIFIDSHSLPPSLVRRIGPSPTNRRPPSTPRLRRSPSRRTGSCRSVPPARGLRGSSSRSRLPLPTPGRRSSRSASLARRHRSRWRGGTLSSRNSRASWWCSASRARARSWPSRSRARPSAAFSRRLRPSAAPSRWRRSRSRVSRCLSLVLLIFP